MCSPPSIYIFLPSFLPSFTDRNENNRVPTSVLVFIVYFRGVSTHGRSLVPLPFLHAVDVDLKVARFLLSLIPAIIIGTRLKYIYIYKSGTSGEGGRKDQIYYRIKIFPPPRVYSHIYIYKSFGAFLIDLFLKNRGVRSYLSNVHTI